MKEGCIKGIKAILIEECRDWLFGKLNGQDA